MSYIPTSKFGDCSICPSKQVPCVKKGKVLICLTCNNRAKAEKQVEKSKRRVAERNASSKLRSLAGKNVDIRADKGYNELDAWFKERRKEMQNVCCECGKATNMHSDKYYKWSICHIAPKALVKSVATNEFNWVELCWLHHQELDSTFDKAAAMQCFPEIKQKFQLFKHFIPANEMRKVNPHLLKD